MNTVYEKRLHKLLSDYQALIQRENEEGCIGNGVIQRYRFPVLTASHIPLSWRYDFDSKRNPFLMERLGINATFNSGAIKLDNKYFLIARVEAANRKSFFAIAESPNGLDSFQFWEYPVEFPTNPDADTNIYDMRLVQHEDGWIYGLFCTEHKDPAAAIGDESSAVAQCGIVRTKDLLRWDRLADLVTPSPQQRNVVLHPEFVHGKYAFYTRPQDGFITTGKGGGIGFGLSASIENAVIEEEKVIDPKVYHTISEMKNGLGPAPIKTEKGWLHLAHGVRNTAAGLRYTLYFFITDLNDITRIIYKPAGYFMAPEGDERVGDVSNVLFSNGWIADDDGMVYIYYASSDTRQHVATTSIAQLLDYAINTSEDGLSSGATVEAVKQLIMSNKQITAVNTEQQKLVFSQ